MGGLTLFILLLLASFDAHSAPVVAFVGGLLANAGALVVGNALMVAGLSAVGAFVINTAAVMLLNRVAAKKNKQPDREPQDRLHTVRYSVEPRRAIYGEVLTSGTLVYQTSTGSNNSDLHMVIALAGHEVDSIGDVYLGDHLSTDARFSRNQTQISHILVKTGWNANGDSATVNATVAGNTFSASGTDPESIRDSLYAQITGAAGYASAPYTASTDATYTRDESSAAIFRIVLTAKTAGAGFSHSATSSAAFNIDASSQDAQPNVNQPFVYIEKFLGSSNQTACATLMAATSQWAMYHRLLGVAYLYVRLTFDQDIFPTGIPEIKAKVKGKKVYDPRTATTAWSDNWALCARDYLSSSYGMQCASSEIDDATVIAAANISDELVAAPSGNQKRYRCNGTITLDMTPKDILESLERTACGVITPVGGVYRVYAGAYTSPSVTLTESDLRGSIKVRPTLPIDQTYNAVRGTYIEPAQNWQETDFAVQKNATYASQDGGELFRDLAQPFTTDGYQAQRVAKVYLERSRQSILVDFPANLKQAFGLALWDTVRLTISQLGWVNKEFKVVKWAFVDNGVDLTLQEEASASYAWNNGNATTIDPAPNTNLPDPWTAPSPSNFKLLSGTDTLLINGDGTITSRIKGTFTPYPNAFAVAYQYQWRLSINTQWSEVMSALGSEFYLDTVVDGASYDVRLRAINAAGVPSAWVTVSNHRVVGKTELPTNVPWATIEGKTISFGTVSDLDLAGYEFRMHYGVNKSWGDANKLHVGLITYSPFELPEMPSGQVTIMAKAVDTSGNYSLNPTAIITELGDKIVANVVVAFNRATAGWPGTLTGGVNNAGVLEAASSTLMWSNYEVYVDEQFRSPNMWRSDGTLMWQGGFGKMVYEDSIVVSTAIPDATMTIPFTIAGDQVTIEYRPLGPSAMWSPEANDPMWRGDSLAMWETPDFMSWPGSVFTKPDTYQFRITTGAGVTRGRISEFTPTIDVPDVIQRIENLSLVSGGQRLALTKTFNKIVAVNATLQGGGTATTIKVLDKNNTLGPLVQAYDNTLTGTTATADFVIQGY